jgi:hypothetical protein
MTNIDKGMDSIIIAQPNHTYILQPHIDKVYLPAQAKNDDCIIFARQNINDNNVITFARIDKQPFRADICFCRNESAMKKFLDYTIYAHVHALASQGGWDVQHFIYYAENWFLVGGPGLFDFL